VAATSVPLAPSADAKSPAAADTPAASASAPPTAASGAISLRLQFDAASWIEIYDANDRRLIYDIGQPGQVRTVAGPAPLRITVGVASAVNVAVNGRTVPVPRSLGRDAARFTVLPDGSVR
jgi:cytoskeleton protein RodZ